ncbi:unnamed protein product [Sphagnum jensenii]|uniref:Uncharacterized protein n=1 Tax=Sphagnum jensenii TaxID=128206 RepID=A0ABP0VCD9_9BRYO
MLLRGTLDVFCSPVRLHHAQPVLVHIPIPVADKHILVEVIRILHRYRWLQLVTSSGPGWWIYTSETESISLTSSTYNEGKRVDGPASIDIANSSFAWNSNLTPIHFIELVAHLSALCEPYVHCLKMPSTAFGLIQLKLNHDMWYRMYACYVEDGMQMFWVEGLTELIHFAETITQRQTQAFFIAGNEHKSDSVSAVVWEWDISNLGHPRNKTFSVLIQRAILHMCELIALGRDDMWWTMRTTDDIEDARNTLCSVKCPSIAKLSALFNVHVDGGRGGSIMDQGSTIPKTQILSFCCRGDSEWKSVVQFLKRFWWNITRHQPLLYAQKVKQEERIQMFRPVSTIGTTIPALPVFDMLSALLSIPGQFFPSPHSDRRGQKTSFRDKRATQKLDSVVAQTRTPLNKWSNDALGAVLYRNIRERLDPVLLSKQCDLSKHSISWSSLFQSVVQLRHLTTEEEWKSFLASIAHPFVFRVVLLLQTIHELSSIYDRWWPDMQDWVIRCAFRHMVLQYQQEMKVSGSIHLPTYMNWYPTSQAFNMDVFEWTQSILVPFGALSDVDRRARRTASSKEDGGSPNMWVDYRETIVNTCMRILASHPVYFQQRVCVVVSKDMMWTKEESMVEFTSTEDVKETLHTLTRFDLVMVSLEYLSQVVTPHNTVFNYASTDGGVADDDGVDSRSDTAHSNVQASKKPRGIRKAKAATTNTAPSSDGPAAVSVNSPSSEKKVSAASKPKSNQPPVSTTTVESVDPNGYFRIKMN